MNSFPISIKDMEQELFVCAGANIVPLLLSSPGMGKSSLVRAFAEKYKLKLIDVRLSQCVPEDLNGLPMRQGEKATFTPYDIFPLDTDAIPAGTNGWLLFLDELTAATKPVQAASYKLILDRMVGSHKLHPAVVIVAAGNRVSDKAVANQLSTALQSRVVTYKLQTTLDDFSDVMVMLGMDPRIQAFLHFMPQRMNDFRPDHQDFTFPCQRTWEMLSNVIRHETEITSKHLPRISGTIGSGAAIEFVTFCKEWQNMPRFEDIVATPKTAMVPNQPAGKFATAVMVAGRADNANLPAVEIYMNRFDVEFQVLTYRLLVANKPALASHPTVVRVSQALIKTHRAA